MKTPGIDADVWSLHRFSPHTVVFSDDFHGSESVAENTRTFLRVPGILMKRSCKQREESTQANDSR